MTVTALPYADWKAPSADGELLIWPAPTQLLSDTRENQRRLSGADAIRIQNLPLPELRRAQRQWLGHVVQEAPLIATGHQTELYHPGVWAEHALINAVAGTIDGQAMHVAVDTDSPKHLMLRWPGGAEPITDDPGVASAHWTGQLAAPSPAHLAVVQTRLETAARAWPSPPASGEFFATLRRLSIDSSGLAADLTNAVHALDWSLGLRHQVLLVSPVLGSDPYLALVHHILSRPDRFAADYNGALRDYRAAAGIVSQTRPMPDLQVGSGQIEVPFWLDGLADGTRRRAAVHRRGLGWVLAGEGGDDFALDPAADGWAAAQTLAAWLRRHHLRLSPRALTLTLFLRLLVVDQFVHGIGGARYDQVADRLIAAHFGLAPPRFAVTTATLVFPTAAGRSRVCLSCLKQEGHRLRHRLLGERKMELVRQIAAIPRLAAQRSLAFHAMHNELQEAAKNHPAMLAFEKHYRLSESQAREDQVLFDRELFYALQPRERLEGLIERYGQAMHGS